MTDQVPRDSDPHHHADPHAEHREAISVLREDVREVDRRVRDQAESIVRLEVNGDKTTRYLERLDGLLVGENGEPGLIANVLSLVGIRDSARTILMAVATAIAGGVGGYIWHWLTIGK